MHLTRKLKWTVCMANRHCRGKEKSEKKRKRERGKNNVSLTKTHIFPPPVFGPSCSLGSLSKMGRRGLLRVLYPFLPIYREGRGRERGRVNGSHLSWPGWWFKPLKLIQLSQSFTSNCVYRGAYSLLSELRTLVLNNTRPFLNPLFSPRSSS